MPIRLIKSVGILDIHCILITDFSKPYGTEKELGSGLEVGVKGLVRGEVHIRQGN